MNKDTLKGDWNTMVGKVKQQWGKLTDDDLTRISGSHDELIGRLQKAYGKSKEEVEKEVDDFYTKH